MGSALVPGTGGLGTLEDGPCLRGLQPGRCGGHRIRIIN